MFRIEILSARFRRLLKNTHLLRCAHPSSLQRTAKYASFLMISRALHLNVFDQPGKNNFFDNLLLQNGLFADRCMLRPSS
jgi:hypothetical protein